MKTILAILLIVCTIPAFGQYQYYTNFDQNQIHDNASFTGNICGPRLQTNFKAFRKVTIDYGYLSYDQPINLKNGDYIGVGGRIMRRNTEIIDKNSVSILTSYNKQISNKNEIKQFLSFGFGFTFAQHKIDNDDIRWPSQIDSSGFNPELPGEEFIGDFFYPEIEIGLSYSLIESSNEFLRVGASIKDLNQPNISFLGSNTIVVPTTLIISAMGSTKALDNLFWQPQVRFHKTLNRRNISFNSNFKFITGGKSKGVIFGAGYSNNNIFNLNLGADLGRFTGIFSYDFNLKSETVVFVNPSLEFGLGYRFCD
jgi:type IX secretion system PorP/SprF family membrane protein